MSAYLIARITVTDPARYERYKALSPAAIAAAGGRFIVRGGAVEMLEGEDETRRVVVVEFPDMAAARAFYDSDLYRRARAEREGAAEFQAYVVEGVDGDGGP